MSNLQRMTDDEIQIQVTKVHLVLNGHKLCEGMIKDIIHQDVCGTDCYDCQKMRLLINLQ